MTYATLHLAHTPQLIRQAKGVHKEMQKVAASCYCGCVEQLEPEQIELLAAMADVVVPL